MSGVRRVTRESLGAWVIKCNPAKTNVEPMLAAGWARSQWCVADNYRSAMMAPDQRVLFWVTSHRQRGIWGAGRITAAPVLSGGSLEVGTAIRLFDEPVTVAALRGVPGLETLEVFRSPQQSNPSWVSAREWSVLEPLLSACG
ncbi:hypothetical protein BH11ACT7_BH11ACT7_38850 [soil metagenome]